jgi:hypothetical protein
VEAAFKVGGIDFAAGQRHRLESPLVAKRRLLIGLLFSGRFSGRAFLVRVLVRLGHRKVARTAPFGSR